MSTFQTERLLLRQFSMTDQPAFHELLQQKEIMRYFPRPEAPDMDRVGRIIQSQIDHWEEYGYGWWAVELKKSPGQLIGWSGLQYLPDTDEIEVAYLLSQKLWGRGLATEGGHAALRFGFQSLGIEQIIGIAHRENLASCRVLEKLGMGRRRADEYFGMHVFRYEIDRIDYSMR